MKAHRVFTALIALMCLVTSDFITAQPAPKQTTLKFATLTIAGAAGLMLAESEGILRKHGIGFEAVPMRTPADGIANLVAGRVQVTLINVGGLAAAAQQKIPLKVISPMYFSNADQGIYVKSDSPIKSVADLKGKTIALGQLKNNFHALVLEKLARAGLSPDDAKFTLIPFPNVAASLLSGSIDAGQIVEPYITQAGAAIRPIIADVWDIYPKGRRLIAYVVTTQQFAKENPELFSELKAALAEAMVFADGHPEEVRKRIGTYTEVSPELLKKMIMPAFGTDIARDVAEQQVDLMVKFKLLDGTVEWARFF